jgi:hypothetical protein
MTHLVAGQPGGVVRREREIAEAFQSAGATTPDRAATAATLGVHEGIAFRILCSHGILQEVGAQRFYLDEPRWESHQAKRRRLGFMIPAIVLLVAIVAFFWLTHR